MGQPISSTPVSSITPAQQHAALQNVRAILPFSLECLRPVLKGLLAAYDEVVPPHQRPIEVSCFFTILTPFSSWILDQLRGLDYEVIGRIVGYW